MERYFVPVAEHIPVRLFKIGFKILFRATCFLKKHNLETIFIYLAVVVLVLLVNNFCSYLFSLNILAKNLNPTPV